jgi:hypothetical protein
MVLLRMILQELKRLKKKRKLPGAGWFPPAILAIQEAEIRRIMVQSQSRQIIHEALSRKNPTQKRAGETAQGVGPEFKPRYCKK